MMKRNKFRRWIFLAALAFPLLACAQSKPVPAIGKLKVFILAGQSNMQGHAEIGTFDYIGDAPVTAPILKEMRDASGKPRVCDTVWITLIG